MRRLVTRVLEAIEEAVPRQKGVDAFVAGQRPDLLLITPLIELGSPQLDYLRAARALGIRSALCVWSWDHLSSKALIRVAARRRAGVERGAARGGGALPRRSPATACS